MIGYALFYFVRKNFAFAMPSLGEEYGITNTSFGIILSLVGIIYGLSKFVNGIIADRTVARWHLAIGLAACSVFNLLFGWSDKLSILITGQAGGAEFVSTMVIIMARSCAGTPTLFSGDRRDSIPSVRWIGFVVRVRRDAPIMRNESLRAMNTAVLRPCLVMCRIPHSKIGSPCTMNIFSKKVKAMRKKMGFRPLNMNFRGTLDAAMANARASSSMAKPRKSFTTKTATMYTIVAMIFVLASSLWIIDPPG